MRFLLLCPAALLFLAYVAERVVADPESVTLKSDSPGWGALAQTNSKSDSIDDTPPPANRIEGVSVGKGERSLSGASGGGGKGDSPDSAPESGKDDTVVVVISKDAPSDVNKTSTKDVKELRQQLADEQAKVKNLYEQSAKLMASLQKSHVEVSRLERESTNLTSQLRTAKRKLAVQEMRVNSARTSLERCQKSGGDLNGLEIAKLVEEETRRQVEDRQAAIDFAQKLKYLTLLSDLRQRIQRDMIEPSARMEGPTQPPTTTRPPNGPWD